MPLHLRTLERLLLPCALVAASAVPGLAAPAPDGPAGWALGASIAAPGFYLGGLGGLGGLSTPAVAEPGLLVERRLDERWWLTFGASGALSDNGGATARAVSGRVGARFVLDPGARVRVAPTFSVVAGAAGAEASATVDGEARRSESRSVRVGAELGLDVELAVTDGFALRLQATLLSVVWSSARSDYQGDVTETDGVTASLGVRPTLAAVFAF